MWHKSLCVVQTQNKYTSTGMPRVPFYVGQHNIFIPCPPKLHLEPMSRILTGWL